MSKPSKKEIRLKLVEILSKDPSHNGMNTENIINKASQLETFILIGKK